MKEDRKICWPVFGWELLHFAARGSSPRCLQRTARRTTTFRVVFVSRSLPPPDTWSVGPPLQPSLTWESRAVFMSTRCWSHAWSCKPDCWSDSPATNPSGSFIRHLSPHWLNYLKDPLLFFQAFCLHETVVLSCKSSCHSFPSSTVAQSHYPLLSPRRWGQMPWHICWGAPPSGASQSTGR